MVKFEIVDAADAPAKPKPMSKSARESWELIQALEPGKVARVPADAEERRRLKLSLTRVGAANGRKVECWESDDALFVQLAEAETKA